MNRYLQRRRPRRRLTFTPLAYLKLQYLCHRGPTEVGAFAITSLRQPLYIEEIHTIPQHNSAISVEFDDNAIADYFDQCVERGLKPAQFARVWLHSHPGECPLPSGTDEETFERVFGVTDWAVMAIISRSSHFYGRLQLNRTPGAICRLAWQVDWANWPTQMEKLSSCEEAWNEEYHRNVNPLPGLSHTLVQQLDQWYAFSGGKHGSS